MKIEFNKVTRYSKLLAVIVFVITIILAFWLGRLSNNDSNLKQISQTEQTTEDLIANQDNVARDEVVNLKTESEGEYHDPAGRFSFKYPKEFHLSIDGEERIKITSVQIPEVDEERCKKLETSRDLWAQCKNPAGNLSPNITIKFEKGNSKEIIEKQYVAVMEQGQLITNSGIWQYGWVGDEYGGTGRYLLPQKDGVILTYYSHEDMGGGVQFSYLKSDIYQLDRSQQKELLEDILRTFKVN